MRSSCGNTVVASGYRLICAAALYAIAAVLPLLQSEGRKYPEYLTLDPSVIAFWNLSRLRTGSNPMLEQPERDPT